MKLHNFPQRSPEWCAARAACLVTASDMGPWIFKTDATSAKARTKRICEHLAAKSGIPKDAWQLEAEEQEEKRMRFNIPVQRGNALEDAARQAYAIATGSSGLEMGFITTDDGLAGASPDWLIYNTTSHGTTYGNPIRGLEIKCPMPEKHLEYLLNGGLPDEYRGQVHSSMVIAELTEWDFWSYCPGYPPLHVRVTEDAFTRDIAVGLQMLKREYLAAEAKLSAIWEASTGRDAA